MKQKGEGCDYTIGCGTVAYSFEAADYIEAFRKIKDDFGWDDLEDEDYTAADVEDRFITGEYALESFVIYKVESKMENLLVAYADTLMREKSGAEEDKETKARREQYEALKKEFE